MIIRGSSANTGRHCAVLENVIILKYLLQNEYANVFINITIGYQFCGEIDAI